MDPKGNVGRFLRGCFLKIAVAGSGEKETGRYIVVYEAQI